MSEKRKIVPSPSRRRKVVKAVLGVVVSIVCLWAVLRSVEKEGFIAAIRGADLWLIFAAIDATVYSYILRAWRWPYFFAKQPPKFYDSFRCLMVGFFMNNILPARMGEVVRAYLGGKATKQSGTTVLATVAAERLADGLSISVLFAILFSFTATQEAMRAKEIFFVAYLFLAATLMTALVVLLRDRIFSALERLGEIMPGHISGYTLVRIKRFIQGLEPLLRPSRIIILAAFSAAVWTVELLVYYLVSAAFDVQMTLGGLSLFLAAVNFSSLIPAAPGGIGVIEALATVALTRIGVDKETALAMVASQHIIQYLVVGAPGAFFSIFHLGGKIIDTAIEAESVEENGITMPAFADVSNERPATLKEKDTASNEQAVYSGAGGEGLISIVIPAYNEQDRLPKTLLSILEYIKSRPDNFEILVVDDGSKDGTSEVARKFSTLSPAVRLLAYPQNRGKGYAVRFGIMNARGHLVLYADADGATPIEEIERLEQAIARGAHLAIGSRAMFSKETAVETVWYRKYIGRVFNGLVNMLILPGIADTQCGFKMFVGPVAHYIFARTQAERFSFDVEVLFLARKAKLKIAEVPINWTNVPGSKVNLARDSMAMAIDIVKFRLRDVFGGYGSTSYEDFAKAPERLPA